MYEVDIVTNCVDAEFIDAYNKLIIAYETSKQHNFGFNYLKPFLDAQSNFITIALKVQGVKVD